MPAIGVVVDNVAMGDIELYKDKKHKMSIVTGYFGPMDHQRVEKKSKELDVQINDIKSKLLKIYDAQTDLDALVKEFDPLRKKIYREIGAIEDIAEKIIIKVRNRIDAKIKGDDFGKLIESQGDFVDLQEREKKSELGIQVFGGDDKDPDGSKDKAAYQEAIDEEIEKKAFELIQAKIMNIEVNNREGVFSKLRKQLAPVLEASTLGSKDAQDTKEFVVTTLKDAIQGLGGDPDKRAKVLLLNRLIADYKK
jgi:hypothetical protein